jgi:hypothetical protein
VSADATFARVIPAKSVGNHPIAGIDAVTSSPVKNF